MGDFRYAQFCPLARATEIVGERWTLLVVRELLLGERRFSGLLRPLAGVSSSVLSDRLGRLEARGLVTRRELPPPAPATVYELTEAGRGLLPVVVELSRWGARFLEVPQADEHMEPAWFKLACLAFARTGPSAPRAFRVTVRDARPRLTFFLRGGPRGTAVLDQACEVDASLEADGLTLMALASGRAEPGALLGAGTLSVEGAEEAALEFPDLFDFQSHIPNETRRPPA